MTDPTGMTHEKTSEAIIGAAMKVLNALKPEPEEKIYENALVPDLRIRGHRVSQQTRFDVRHEGEVVGTLIPDLIADDVVLADPKVVEEFTRTPTAKMIGDPAIMGLRVALLLNFKHADLRWKRIVR